MPLVGLVRLEPMPPGWIVTHDRPTLPPDRRGFTTLHAARQFAIELAEREGLLLVDRSSAYDGDS